MRCDLHVHTVHSGMCSVPVLRRLCRESYNDPLALYLLLQKRGMGLMTVTDHDSIEAAESLRRFRDFFVSEEVTVHLPSGTEAHIGVYDITDRQHLGLQERRDDAERFFAYLDEERLIASANHPLSSLTGRRMPEDFGLFHRLLAVEGRNGAMRAATNRAAVEWASRNGKRIIAGSDAHALRPAGRTYTEVPDARDKDEFLAGIRSGRSQIHGAHGGYFALTRDVLEIVRGLLRERPVAFALTPLLALLPVVLLINTGREAFFSALWRERLRDKTARLPVPEVIA